MAVATRLYRLGAGGLLGYAGQVSAPLPARTLFGCAVTAYPGSGRTQEEELIAHQADCGTAAVHRHYDPGMPTSWATTTGATYAGWEDRWTWTSVKPDVAAFNAGTLDGQVTAWLDSIPQAKPGIRRMITCWHEPETKLASGQLTPLSWKQAAYRFGQLVRSRNRPDLLYGPIFTSHWNLVNPDHKVEQCWTADATDLASVSDFIGWDPYNLESSDARYDATFQGVASMAFYFDPIVTWVQQNAPGLPVAIGETGYIPSNTDLALRPAWLQAVANYALQQRFLCVNYFDASITGESFLNHWYLRAYETTRGDDTTLVRDEATISVWANTYAANPLAVPA